MIGTPRTLPLHQAYAYALDIRKHMVTTRGGRGPTVPMFRFKPDNIYMTCRELRKLCHNVTVVNGDWSQPLYRWLLDNIPLSSPDEYVVALGNRVVPGGVA